MKYFRVKSDAAVSRRMLKLMCQVVTVTAIGCAAFVDCRKQEVQRLSQATVLNNGHLFNLSRVGRL